MATIEADKIVLSINISKLQPFTDTQGAQWITVDVSALRQPDDKGRDLCCYQHQNKDEYGKQKNYVGKGKKYLYNGK